MREDPGLAEQTFLHDTIRDRWTDVRPDYINETKRFESSFDWFMYQITDKPHPLPVKLNELARSLKLLGFAFERICRYPELIKITHIAHACAERRPEGCTQSLLTVNADGQIIEDKVQPLLHHTEDQLKSMGKACLRCAIDRKYHPVEFCRIMGGVSEEESASLAKPVVEDRQIIFWILNDFESPKIESFAMSLAQGMVVDAVNRKYYKKPKPPHTKND